MVALTSASCRLIDDDLSVCGSESDYLIDYQVKLVTEVHMEIDEKLSSEIEKPIAEALKGWSDTIFSGRAHDLDMNFYSLDGTDELKHHFAEIIDATQKSYTLTIPRENYRHLALVNIVNNSSVSILGRTNASTMYVAQKERDTVESHATAVYTARPLMKMAEGEDLTFDVHLYMASCAVALVIDDSASSAKPTMRNVLLAGTASGFSVCDSVYSFNSTRLVRAQEVMNRCYAVVAFPSRDSIAATPAPMPGHAYAPQQDQSLWQLRAYVQKTDGTITENILTVNKPLKAGTLEIIKVQMNEDGSLVPIQNVGVGVSVTLDWKDGGTHDVVTG